MTFFANSGVAWPQFEVVTKAAGTKSFEAASDLFRILAAIEGEGQSANINELEVVRCAETLDQAATEYAKLGEDLAGMPAKPITPSEAELARLPRRFLPGDYGYDYDNHFLFFGRFSIGDLYRDLSHRLGRLATAIRTLRITVPSVDLAPQVFEILELWESACTIARLIATLGRRSPNYRA